MFFQTLKRFLTSFSILFNFQGPVRLSLAADDLFIVPPKWFFVKPYFLEAFELSELGALQTSQCQLVFSASIGSFQGLPAEVPEVILLPQRLALKYNTTPPPPCQHFLTDFFHSFLQSKDPSCFSPVSGRAFFLTRLQTERIMESSPSILYKVAILII